MKTNLDFLKTDKDKETNGFWHDVGPASFKLKRFGGKNMSHLQQVTAKYYKPYAKLIESGHLPQEKQEEILVKTFVEGILVDWKGITTVDGVEVPFTKEMALELLADNIELVEELRVAASEKANYREDLGNF